MKPTEESVVIAEHAIENEQQLRIAAKVGLAFPTLKERLIVDFLDSLKKTLEVRLGNTWSVDDDDWRDTPLKSGGYIAAWRPKRAVDASIGLECCKAGPSSLIYFVYLNAKLDSPLVVQLRDSLNTGYAHGGREATSIWWKWVEERHRDWNTEEALVWMWRKGEAVEYYANHFIKISK
jgi:hypothetical protein